MLNRLSLQLSQYSYFSFKQTLRYLILQMFGHEALIETNALSKNAHCYKLNIDIYRLEKIKWQHLAYRKLFNPFKWAEFILVAPLEIICWCLQRHSSLIARQLHNKQKTILINFGYFYYCVMFYGISPLINLCIHIALSIPKRLLAPSRYVIRPTIELAKTQPGVFISLLIITTLISGSLAIAIFTGGLSLVALGSTIAMMALAKAAIIIGSAIAAWSTLLKLVTGGQEVLDMIKRTRHIPSYPQTTETFLENSSTAKMTEALHAINPTLTRVIPATEQNCGHTLALLSGTESLFYKPTIETIIELAPLHIAKP